MRGFLIPRKSRHPAAPAAWGLRNMDDIFDDFWKDFALTRAGGAGAVQGFAPRLDVKENDADYTITVELPGLEEKDFDISLEEDVLTIKGEKKSKHEEDREGYHHVETVSGRFERRLRVPEGIDGDAVKASYKNGVVTVTLPKVEQPEPEVRSIPVTAS
jgi:HSP20 family protein